MFVDYGPHVHIPRGNEAGKRRQFGTGVRFRGGTPSGPLQGSGSFALQPRVGSQARQPWAGGRNPVGIAGTRISTPPTSAQDTASVYRGRAENLTRSGKRSPKFLHRAFELKLRLRLQCSPWPADRR